LTKRLDCRGRLGVQSSRLGQPERHLNNNNVVDAADYVVGRQGLGTTYDQNDYKVWRAHFGTSLGPVSGAAIPSAEPLLAAVP
jgi:hypothetical protein